MATKKKRSAKQKAATKRMRAARASQLPDEDMNSLVRSIRRKNRARNSRKGRRIKAKGHGAKTRGELLRGAHRRGKGTVVILIAPSNK